MFDPIVQSRIRKNQTRWRLRADARPLPRPWRWPLARVLDHEPVVLAEHVTQERRGVDLGYELEPFDAQLRAPVYAIQDGDVLFAGETKSGFAVCIDHGRRDWATYYAHMSTMFIAPYYGQPGRRRQRVRSGDVIGFAAKSPIHIRFELWNWTEERGFVPVDPVAQIASWIGPLAPSKPPTTETQT